MPSSAAGPSRRSGVPPPPVGGELAFIARRAGGRSTRPSGRGFLAIRPHLPPVNRRSSRRGDAPGQSMAIDRHPLPVSWHSSPAGVRATPSSRRRARAARVGLAPAGTTSQRRPASGRIAPLCRSDRDNNTPCWPNLGHRDFSRPRPTRPTTTPAAATTPKDRSAQNPFLATQIGSGGFCAAHSSPELLFNRTRSEKGILCRSRPRASTRTHPDAPGRTRPDAPGRTERTSPPLLRCKSGPERARANQRRTENASGAIVPHRDHHPDPASPSPTD